MGKFEFSVNETVAEAIARLSALEQLRDQARDGGRAAMVQNIEKLIEAELRSIHRMRNLHAGTKTPDRESERPGD